MPKPIKKKTAKQEARAGESVRSMMSFLSENVRDNLKYVAGAAAAVLVVAVAVAGFFMYRGSAEKEAQEALYEGYKQFYGLYDAAPLPRGERLDKALDNFRKAYKAGGSPQALMYVANVQYAQGKYDESVKSLEELLGKFPNDEVYAPLALYKAAMAEVKAAKPEEALKYLERLDSASGGSYKDLALAEAAGILEGLGRKEEAAKKYEALLERYPGSPLAGEARFKLGKDEPAEKEKAEAGKEGG